MTGMLSKLEHGNDWSTEPVGEGENANHKAVDYTERMNEHDDRFYALYYIGGCGRGGMPNKIFEEMNGPDGVRYETFIEKSNPFLPKRYPMYGIKSPNVQRCINLIERTGYRYKIREDVSHFCFNPRPTIGEIVVRPKDAEL